MFISRNLDCTPPLFSTFWSTVVVSYSLLLGFPWTDSCHLGGATVTTLIKEAVYPARSEPGLQTYTDLDATPGFGDS